MKNISSPTSGNFPKIIEFLSNNGNFVLEIPIVNEHRELTVTTFP